jgi:hypothetical protein
MKHDVSESIKGISVDGEEFRAAISKLLESKPTSKPEIADKIKVWGRRRNLRTPVLDRQRSPGSSQGL